MPEQKDLLTKMVAQIMNGSANDINVMYLAKIVKISPPTADIQPLAMINGNKGNIISKAHFLINPTSKNETLNYSVGDNVVVGCLDHDNMYFNNKDKFKVDTDKKHSIDYAIILGRYAKKEDFKGSD